MSKLFAFSAVLAFFAFGFRAMAQDAQKGKEYEITIQSEQDNEWTGRFGAAKIGNVVVAIPEAKKDQKYKVKITDVKPNSYTGTQQASCEFQQIGGDRKGNCLGAP